MLAASGTCSRANTLSPSFSSAVSIDRPRTGAKKEAAIRAALARGDKGKHKIAAELGVGSGTVARIRAEMAGAA